MEKQISFQGVSLNPYGDISPDGELSACVNLQSHGGSLRPSVLEGTEYQVADNDLKLITIHATSDYRHMILYDGTSLYWADEQSGSITANYIASIQNLKSVNTIGNTLSVLCDAGLVYILYRNNQYMYLGQLPEVTLSFALEGYGDRTAVKTVSIETIPGADIGKDFSDNNKQTITNAVMADVNELVKEKQENGLFVFPFFVRYALRLYDGELIHHSVPVLMSCTNRKSVIAYYRPDVTSMDDITQVSYYLVLCYFELYFKSDKSKEELEKWSDIITSIDVYISEPVYTFYPDKQCERFFVHDFSDCYGICSVSTDHLNNFKKRTLLDIANSNLSALLQQIRQIELPYKDDEELVKDIKGTSNFYFLKSISINDLSSSFSQIVIDASILNNITFRERMTDDYDSHDKIYSESAFVYNKRLVLANIKKEIYQGQSFDSCVTYQNEPQGIYTYICYIYAKIGGNNVVFQLPGYIRSSNAQIDYFYFPYSEAYKAVFVQNYYNSSLYIVNLEKHPLLNGVYFCSGFSNGLYLPGNAPSVIGSNIVSLPNYIYLSEVDNPFYFPVEGINTVGTGEIIGLSAITTALSQGQFGSFPLMAFCTDGNYALQVNSEGLFSNVSPMQRDVCTNPASITQIDGAIVFVSARGVMLANGSDIRCISVALDGVYDDLSNIDISRVKAISNVPPVDFFQNCLIAYDYSGKRLLFMKPASAVQEYGWQYDIETSKWQQIDFAGAMQVVNVYPFSYIQQLEDAGNVIKKLELPYDYSHNADDLVAGVLVTRPLKLDSLQLKSVSQIRLEGNFSHIQRMWLYGSNNLRDWFLIGATSNKRMLLRGRCFKFFRIAITTQLANCDNISGCRIVYTIKPEYRLR